MLIHECDCRLRELAAIGPTLGLFVQAALAHDFAVGFGASDRTARITALYNEHLHPWLRIFDKRPVPEVIHRALKKRTRCHHRT